ncbi:MAG: endolytic transglycosylase MltG [Candidatus Nealsonbacteria bacterium]|nr:endolytic transglycosylase MltG [Candidatus Nealsonbacteria bacterium]
MRKRLFFIILIIMIAAISFWLIFLPTESFSKKEVIFSVEIGEGSKDIALNLAKENLIRWASMFRVYVMVRGIAGDLKAGQYLLSPSMNIPQIAEKLFKGDVIKEKITIIEGWSLRTIGFYFEDRGMFQAEEVLDMAAKDFSDEFDFLKDKPKNLGLEGYLFPDTYEIRKNESLENIVKKMLSNFDRKLTSDLKEEIKRQQKSIFEIVTMASILEKEVRTVEDKKIVSGIFWKKINNGEPLYSCATIAYILGRENWTFEEDESSSLSRVGAWTFEEMRREIASGKDIDSPYNTYKYQGLPLGPISNPGLESIMATIYPEESDYRYYLSTPEGETIFSKTLEEHNIAKAKYFE